MHSTTYFINKNFSATAGAAFDLIINPLYNIRNEDKETVGNDQINNWHFEFALKYRL